MKKFVCLGLAVLSMLLPINSFAATGIILDGRTLVPARGVFQDMGFKVSWDSENKIATLEDDTYTVMVYNNGKVISTNKNKGTVSVVESDGLGSPENINGSIYFPVRLVGNAIGATVSWDSETKIATLGYNGKNYSVQCNTNKSNGKATINYEMCGYTPEFASVTGCRLVDFDEDDTDYWKNNGYVYKFPDGATTEDKNKIISKYYNSLIQREFKYDSTYKNSIFLICPDSEHKIQIGIYDDSVVISIIHYKHSYLK